MSGLRPVVDDGQLAVLRILVDRTRSLGEEHTRLVSQLHHPHQQMLDDAITHAVTGLEGQQGKRL